MVVFLRPAAPALDLKAAPLRVVAMAQGKLSVVRDADGVEVATADLSGLELVERGGSAAVHKVAQPIRVADLEAQVKATLPAVDREIPDAVREGEGAGQLRPDAGPVLPNGAPVQPGAVRP